MQHFNNKLVMVTGASGTLGAEVAQQFSEAGASVILTGRNPGRLEQVRKKLINYSLHRCYACDLADEVEVQKLFEQIADESGQIHCLANIAGGFKMGDAVHELSVQKINQMFDLNFITTLNATRFALQNMLKFEHGRIVNVSARAAVEGKARMAPYCISKRAVITLTESLAAEHKQDDININCILPGTIDTPSNRQDMPDADFSKWVKPADLATVILELCSEQMRAVNGACIPVYGKS